MTREQLKESGVQPGWLFQVVDELTGGCHPDPEGCMAQRCGQTLTVREVHADTFLKAYEDYNAGEAPWQNGWSWYPEAIAAVFPPHYDSNDNIEVASDDELNGFLFG